MKQPFLLIMLAVLALCGCQSTTPQKTAVIAPPHAGSDEPTLKWVKRGNVFHLEIDKED